MRKTFSVILALAAVACQYDPYSSEYTTAKPSSTEMSGAYSLDSESQALLRDRFKVDSPPAKLVLNLDHTFEITQVPSCWRKDSVCTSATEHARGNWTIARDQEWWSVSLICTEISGEQTEYGLAAKVRGDQPPRLIHFTIGDPDTGEALSFQKVGGAT